MEGLGILGGKKRACQRLKRERERWDKATKRGVEGFAVVVRKRKDRRINSIKEEGGNSGVSSRRK